MEGDCLGRAFSIFAVEEEPPQQTDGHLSDQCRLEKLRDNLPRQPGRVAIGRLAVLLPLVADVSVQCCAQEGPPGVPGPVREEL